MGLCGNYAARRGSVGLINRIFQIEGLNYVVTNRIPRQFATRMMGRISRIESARFVGVALWVWKLFAPELDLSEAKPAHFGTLRDVFVRKLAPGARPVDADPLVMVGPCDAVVGACGRIDRDTLIQAKGLDYRLLERLRCDDLAKHYENGRFVTLRLKATMYHRFHAPAAGRVRSVNYISGDTWNVNPIAVAVLRSLACAAAAAKIPHEESGTVHRSRVPETHAARRADLPQRIAFGLRTGALQHEHAGIPDHPANGARRRLA